MGYSKSILFQNQLIDFCEVEETLVIPDC